MRFSQVVSRVHLDTIYLDTTRNVQRKKKVQASSVIRRIVISVRKAEADRFAERILVVSPGQPFIIISR